MWSLRAVAQHRLFLVVELLINAGRQCSRDVVVLLEPPAAKGRNEGPASSARLIGGGSVPQAAVPNQNVAGSGSNRNRLGERFLIGITIGQMRSGHDHGAAILWILIF